MKNFEITYKQYGCYGASTVFESNAQRDGITIDEAVKRRIAQLEAEGARIIGVAEAIERPIIFVHH